MKRETKEIWMTIIICLTFIIIFVTLIAAIFYHQVLETPYEKCIDACISDDCRENCNDAVENIIADLTDSIDKFDWEEILK